MSTPQAEPARELAQNRDALAKTKDEADETEFKDRLSDEYKILQDKIDKIGAFRFTIKGWSITAVVGALATASGRRLSTTLILALGLVSMMFFFFWLEYEQVRLSRLFGARAARIEDAFRRISRSKAIFASFPVPFTAHELGLAGHHQKLRGRSQRPAAAPKASKPSGERWRICKQAHIVFYFVLILLALAPLVSHHHSIHDHWKVMWQGIAQSSRNFK